MKVIRRGVFETNSSSTHSITLTRKPFTPTPWSQFEGTGEGKVVVVYPGEFGWEMRSYDDPETKASYALTYAHELLRGGGEFYTHNANDSSRLIRMLYCVLEKETGCDVKFRTLDDEIYPHGYIDHQSHDVAARVFKNPSTLRRFIFDPACILVTDNDNH